MRTSRGTSHDCNSGDTGSGDTSSGDTGSGDTGSGDTDSGMVTLELAMAIPVLLIVCVSLVWVVNLGRVDVLAQDASRAAVRELVRGGGAGRATAAAHGVLPDSQVSISVSNTQARATVAIELRGPAPLLSGMSHRLEARSVGSMEVP